MPDVALRFLEGGGQMGRAIAEFDWAATPLGPIATWEPALKIAAGMMVSSAFPKCLCWGPEFITLYNDAFVPILGDKHPSLGNPFSQTWSEVWSDVQPIAERALIAGEATFIEDFPLDIRRSERVEEAYFTFCYSPVRDEHGRIRGMLDTVIETTGKVRTEQRALVRNRELIHRSRNAYALVSALVGQTCRTSASMEEAQQKIQSRLSSLVRSQDILASNPEGDATVAELVERTLEPFAQESGTVEVGGPEVRIGRNQVTALALALHELATNAAKYGALSAAGGHVAITWTVGKAEPEPRFTLDWVETGGPPVEHTTRRGFGSFLIEEMLAREFDGEVNVEMSREGLRFHLACPAAQLL